MLENCCAATSESLAVVVSTQDWHQFPATTGRMDPTSSTPGLSIASQHLGGSFTLLDGGPHRPQVLQGRDLCGLQRL